MKRYQRILITIGGLILLVGVMSTIKGLQIGRMVAQGKANVAPPETVTAEQVLDDSWETLLTAVGSLQAVQGVMVAAELPGRVTQIAFEPGTAVAAGQLLVRQDISAERAQERAAQSELDLALKNFDRAKAMLPEKVISRSTYDDRRAAYETAAAQLDNIRAAIEKKTIRAPFAGRLGIRQINLGESLEAGQPVVSLQSLDPIFVNFLLPQQEISRLQKDLAIRVTTDALRERSIDGMITAINSEVDSTTRNIRVQGILKNPDEALRPGMYVNVAVVLPGKKRVLAIPATAVMYAPYSDSVFVVEDKPMDEGGAPGKVVRQQFVKLGEKRGDFITVRAGLKPGETVVSTGVFKLRNGQAVVVDNSVSPEFKLNPEPDNA